MISYGTLCRFHAATSCGFHTRLRRDWDAEDAHQTRGQIRTIGVTGSGLHPAPCGANIPKTHTPELHFRAARGLFVWDFGRYVRPLRPAHLLRRCPLHWLHLRCELRHRQRCKHAFQRVLRHPCTRLNPLCWGVDIRFAHHI